MKDILFPYVWIERKYRQECLKYTDFASGIRIKYDPEINCELTKALHGLVEYLRRTYYFPVRCNVLISNHRRYHSREDGHIYYGIFYDNQNICKKRLIYPQIFIAGQLWKHRDINDVLYCFLHELTHYFQWFFEEDKIRTDRSLELEANQWAGYILDSYLNQ